jgi:hypothetical protein
MHETPEELAALQRLLDESYESAGRHLRSIITPQRRLTAGQVCEELQGMTLLALATVTADCAPLIGPVDGHFLHGKFWFGSAPHSVRFQHIRKRPQVSATHIRGEQLVVTVHGVAVEIDVTTGEYEFLHDHFRTVYPDFDSWGFWGDAPYARIEPRFMYAGSFKDVQ